MPKIEDQENPFAEITGEGSVEEIESEESLPSDKTVETRATPKLSEAEKAGRKVNQDKAAAGKRDEIWASGNVNQSKEKVNIERGSFAVENKGKLEFDGNYAREVECFVRDGILYGSKEDAKNEKYGINAHFRKGSKTEKVLYEKDVKFLKDRETATENK